MTGFNPTKGMKDFPSTIANKRHIVMEKIKSAYKKNGFSYIETPAVESLSLLEKSQGGENQKMIFYVGRGEKNNQIQDLGLRFDLTIPLMRFYNNNKNILNNIVQYMQIGSVWRAERPQKGRYRQFTQCDIDVIGTSETIYIMNIFSAILDALSQIKIDDIKIIINDRKIIDDILTHCSIPNDKKGSVLIIIDKMDKIGKEKCMDLLSDIGISKEQIAKLFDLIENKNDTNKKSDIINIANLIKSKYNVDVEIDHKMVRGMNYYTGIIFEIKHNTLGLSIAGGGQYKNVFDGKTDCIGGSIGFERIMDIINDEKIDFNEKSAKTIALIYDKKTDTPETVLKIFNNLKNEYEKVQITTIQKKLSRQIDSLKNEGFNFFGIIEGQKAIVKPIK